MSDFGHLPHVFCGEGKRTKLYALLDPRDRTVRYIGVSVSPLGRLRWHLRKPLRCLSWWIVELKREGLQPEVKVLGVTCSETWQRTEKSWISFFKGHAALLNEHEGGMWSAFRGKVRGGKPRFSGERKPPKKKRKKKAWHVGRESSKPKGLSLARIQASRPLKPPRRFEAHGEEE